MTAKEYLKQVHYLYLQIIVTQSEIQRLRDLANNISHILKDDDTSISNNNNNKIENIICSIVQLENDLENSINQYLEKIKEVQDKINLISNETQKAILKLRYIDNLSMGDISKILNYTVQHLYRLEQLALQELDTTFKKN